ncbi:MAG: hypothetical protein JO044_17340 [Mycobacteriaceae bacterium]|nr:hypothetical protein [Mycobacteriaceae bacterium]MBV9639767.1 hypothetical protein [Mycobacteriaceae bacterium]
MAGVAPRFCEVSVSFSAPFCGRVGWLFLALATLAGVGVFYLCRYAEAAEPTPLPPHVELDAHADYEPRYGRR